MAIVDRINADVKQALLSGDKELVSVLRGLKSVVLNEEIAQGKRDTGLDDEVVINLFQKEVKKRNEAIELYQKANDQARAEREAYEVEVISRYLPEMLAEEDIVNIVDEVINELGATDMSKMGQVIGEVKKRSEGRADGALIAKIAKEKLV